jgi:hypothetical protein
MSPPVASIVLVTAHSSMARDGLAFTHPSQPRLRGHRGSASDGFLLLDRSKFHAAFAADVPAEIAQFMADSQLPWGTRALSGNISSPAWESKPSWYLVTQNDNMIPPGGQRTMASRIGATTRALPGSHAIYIANPQAVAALIEEAVGEIMRPPSDSQFVPKLRETARTPPSPG